MQSHPELKEEENLNQFPNLPQQNQLKQVLRLRLMSSSLFLLNLNFLNPTNQSISINPLSKPYVLFLLLRKAQKKTFTGPRPRGEKLSKFDEDDEEAEAEEDIESVDSFKDAKKTVAEVRKINNVTLLFLALCIIRLFV